MKKLLLISLILLSLAFPVYSQTTPPSFINYQKVLFDVNAANPNAPLINQSFVTFVNINDELGNLLYREEHFASTDANGLITVKMGDGLYTAGPITNFNQINWGVGKYYLVVDFDINGTISSTAPEQLVTVPYSFYAGKAGNGMTAVADNGDGTLTFTYANGATYITPALSGIQGPAGPAGAQGVPGPQGLAGTNGLNALIKTTTEPAGTNCTNGGTKIETGLDANANGLLDASEIDLSQTQFVCNNNNNVNGGNQIITSGSGFFIVPNNISTIIVELYGAGGGGGSGGYSSCGGCGTSSGGGGGGSGGYTKSIINVSSGQQISFTVGIGGNSNQNGNNTVFGSKSALGGNKGGLGIGQQSSCVNPNNGGTAGAGGNIGLAGGCPGGVTNGSGAGGTGGNAPGQLSSGGTGGAGVNTYVNGNNGLNGETASGAGGGSGCVRNSSTLQGGQVGLGGTGGNGLIIISW